MSIKFFLSRINNQDGSMIVVAMMLLAILTIIGITSTNTTVVENRIAVNDQLHSMAFYHADLGIYSTAKIIGATVEEKEGYSSDDYDFEYNEAYYDDGDEDLEDFYRQITGLDDYDDGEWDIEYVLESDDCTGDECIVRADIEFLGTDPEGDAGGGAVFGEGATTSIGSQEISIYFRIFSQGSAHRNSLASLAARYRKVLGVGGGL